MELEDGTTLRGKSSSAPTVYKAVRFSSLEEARWVARLCKVRTLRRHKNYDLEKEAPSLTEASGHRDARDVYHIFLVLIHRGAF